MLTTSAQQPTGLPFAVPPMWTPLPGKKLKNVHLIKL